MQGGRTKETVMLAKILPTNEHNVERIVRVVAGLGITSLAFVGPQSSWAFLGLIPVITGAVGSCPLYTILGVSTCRMKKR
jgi:hypothetical protein